MKKTDFKDKSSVFFISKGLIILMVILTSSVGFTLGFFVGKFYRPPMEKQTSVPAKEPPSRQSTEYVQKDNINRQTPKAKEEPAPAATPKSGEMQGVKTVQQNGQAKETNPGQAVEKPATPKNNTKTSSPAIYVVQVGAFKNPSDAHVLMLKLDKKGYHAVVIMTKSKNEKMFKVLVGEFNTRDEAEILAIKIKKAESLKAFVTLKTH